MPLRPVLDIEEALKWAYRDELPKHGNDRDRGPGPYVSPMFRMCALGGPVDNWSREPGFPAALGSPHPDAIIVAQAVQDLEPADLDITGFARAYGMDPVGIDVDAIAEAVLGNLTTLVSLRARSGSRPGWQDGIETQPVRSPANGKPLVFQKVKATIEINGSSYDVERDEPVHDNKRRSGTYPVGAFAKITYDPGRVAHYTERAEYAAWHAALVFLAEKLEGVLTSLRPIRPSAPARPWLGEKDAKRSGTTLTVAGTHVDAKRKVYPTRAPRQQPSPVRYPMRDKPPPSAA